MLQGTLHPGLEVSRYKATAHTGRMELNMHVGSAGRKGYTFLLFQYLCIIKLTKIIIIYKKNNKASWHCQPIPAAVSEILLW